MARCASKVRRDRDGAEREASRLRSIDKDSRAYAYECPYRLFWHVSCNCGVGAFQRKNRKNPAKVDYDRRVERWEGRLR